MDVWRHAKHVLPINQAYAALVSANHTLRPALRAEAFSTFMGDGGSPYAAGMVLRALGASNEQVAGVTIAYEESLAFRALNTAVAERF